MARAYHPSTWEAVAGDTICVGGQPGLHIEIQSLKEWSGGGQLVTTSSLTA